LKSISHPALIALLLAGFTLARTAPAQFPLPIRNAPFTANWSSISNDHGKTTTQTGIIARASNGSTYLSSTIQGQPYQTVISDVPNNRVITLLLPSPFQHQYLLRDPPGGHFTVISVQRRREMLQQMQDSYIERPNRPKPDGQAVEIALGVKQQNGITLFGHKSEFTSNSGSKRTDEMWNSDIGIVVGLKSVWLQEGKDYSRTVTDILR
jgi:hypothetical protein